MDGAFDRQILEKLPLGQSVLSLASWCCGADLLTKTYEENRGVCYTKILDFVDFVRIIWGCLSFPWGSARAGLLKQEEVGTLPVTTRAVYKKLAGTPVDVTLGFFRSCMGKLRSVIPTDWENRPRSLREFEVLLMDGKVIKHVPRRLLPLRLDQENACKLLGGRALVLCSRWTNLIWDMELNPDGEANEVKLAPQLIRRAHETVNGKFLIVGDRAFGIFEVCQTILAESGQFVVRKHGNTRFEADPARPAVTGHDRFGRVVTEEWGCILRGKETKTTPCERLPVRLITVHRDKENLVLISSLTDADAYPVDDLLDAYLDRWDIEGAFQKTTEVFHLNKLFSTSPEGTLFQLAFCFLMHNVVQIVKLHVAHHQQREVKSISTEMLFRDVQEELIAAARLLTPEQIAALIPEYTTPEAVQHRLTELLSGCWCNRWIKANYKARDPSKPIKPKPPKIRQTKSHDSVFRVLERSRQ
jgi:hypothetical protein